MEHTYPLTIADLKPLAPLNLTSYRDIRYTGDQMGLSIDDFVEEDRQQIYALYAFLSDMLSIFKQHWDDPEQSQQQLSALVSSMNWTAFLASVRNMGAATYEHRYDKVISQAMHDIKGGGFSGLTLYLQLLGRGADRRGDLARMFFLTRDHLKIMRNAIPGIDPEAEARDRAERAHEARLFVEKWQNTTHQVGDVAAQIIIDCQFAGSISERCLEFSALDRVLYNLINNATRHTADGRVYFFIFPLTEENPHDLRFVVYNSIPAEHCAKLRENYPDDLGELFRGGFTTGGSGIGLRICADFVNNAYGIPSFDKGLEGHYFGARCMNGYFVNWVHWPVAAD
jgi:signal transduction histidine kinase